VRIGSKIAFEVEFRVTTPILSPRNALFLLLSIYRSSASLLYRLVVYSIGWLADVSDLNSLKFRLF
jgi:hypothetical protein